MTTGNDEEPHHIVITETPCNNDTVENNNGIDGEGNDDDDDEEEEEQGAQDESGGDGDEEVDDNDDDGGYEYHCTFAVTKCQAVVQPIYICKTCTSLADDEKGGLPLCICESCAMVCHSDEAACEVVSVGVGPCYCDCWKTGDCQLRECSAQAARQLGLVPAYEADEHGENGDGADAAVGRQLQWLSKEDYQKLSQPLSPETTTPSLSLANSLTTRHVGDKPPPYFPYFHSVCLISHLTRQSTTSRRCCLVAQAVELVRHSTDTHWISAARRSEHTSKEKEEEEEEEEEEDHYCDLERLAHAIYTHHVQHSLCNGGEELAWNNEAGAEWWVQVKKMDKDGASNNPNAPQQDTAATGPGQGENLAIDLHFDKDEELAASFGLGSFPLLSTVTYLTGPPTDAKDTLSPPPTVVFPRTYAEVEPEFSSNDDSGGGGSGMLVSHAVVGKHLVFDGRLLHGAPSHKLLRRKAPTTNTKAQPLDNANNNLRVTLLVNLWPQGRPCGIRPLDPAIRQRLVQMASSGKDDDDDDDKSDKLLRQSWKKQTIVERKCKSTECSPIELPFVSKGATWITDNDEDGDGLVVSLWYPTEQEGDTVRLHFGPGMEPRMKHLVADDDDDDEAEEKSYFR